MVVIYELSNQARRESVVAAGVRPEAPAHWSRREAVRLGVVETGVSRRQAGVFMRWYQRTRARLGWKIVVTPVAGQAENR